MTAYYGVELSVNPEEVHKLNPLLTRSFREYFTASTVSCVRTKYPVLAIEFSGCGNSVNRAVYIHGGCYYFLRREMGQAWTLDGVAFKYDYSDLIKFTPDMEPEKYFPVYPGSAVKTPHHALEDIAGLVATTGRLLRSGAYLIDYMVSHATTDNCVTLAGIPACAYPLIDILENTFTVFPGATAVSQEVQEGNIPEQLIIQADVFTCELNRYRTLLVKDRT